MLVMLSPLITAHHTRLCLASLHLKLSLTVLQYIHKVHYIYLYIHNHICIIHTCIYILHIFIHDYTLMVLLAMLHLPYLAGFTILTYILIHIYAYVFTTIKKLYYSYLNTALLTLYYFNTVLS